MAVSELPLMEAISKHAWSAYDRPATGIISVFLKGPINKQIDSTFPFTVLWSLSHTPYMDNIAGKWLKASKSQISSLWKLPVPLTNLINSPEAGPLHRGISLELDPDTVACGSDWRHECAVTESVNKRRHLTVTISNLVMEKTRESSDDESVWICCQRRQQLHKSCHKTKALTTAFICKGGKASSQ